MTNTNSRTKKRLNTLAVKRDKKQEIFLKELKKCPVISVACARADIGRSTYYEWLENDEEFSRCANEALTEGNGFINDLAESQVIKGIQEGHTTFTIFWLKNKHPDFCEKVSHDYRINIKHEDTPTLSPDEKKVIASALCKIGLANIINSNMEIDFKKVEEELPKAEEICKSYDIRSEEEAKEHRKKSAEFIGIPKERHEANEKKLDEEKEIKKKRDGVILKDFFKNHNQKEKPEVQEPKKELVRKDKSGVRISDIFKNPSKSS